jgi:RHS repeat-associated protein
MLSCLVLSPIFAFAQDSTGILPFSTLQHAIYDDVKINDGTILLRLPVRNKPGLVPFSYSLVSNIAVGTFNGSISVQQAWRPQNSAGLSNSQNVYPKTSIPRKCPNGDQTMLNTNWVFVDSLGSVHRLPDLRTDDAQCLSGDRYSSGSTDSSGYSVSLDSSGSTATVYDRGGNTYTGFGNNSGTFTDPNGNKVTFTVTNGVTTYKDPTGQSPMQETDTSTKATHSWTDGSGISRSYIVNYSQNYNQKTVFGCVVPADISGFSGVWMPSSITAPDGNYNITYEGTPDNPGYVTGRIAKITFPSGASIAYSYTGGLNNSGLTCGLSNNYQMLVPMLTRKLTDAKGNVRVWKYDTTKIANATVVTDPNGNDTVYTFSFSYGFRTIYETQRQYYQGSYTAGNLLKTQVRCYGGNTQNCATAVITPPVLQRDVYTTLKGMTQSSRSETTHDYYGDLTEDKEFDYNGTLVTDRIVTYGSYSNGSCTYPIGNGIYNRVCTDVLKYGTTVVAQTNNTYDAAGNLKVSSRLTGGSNYLTSQTSYNSNGTVNIFTDVNNAQTTYNYDGSCQYTVPTSVSEPLSLSKSMTWNCNGGVVTNATDENQQPTTYTHTDPFWRVKSVTAPFNGATDTTTNYTYTPTTSESSLVFNSNASTADQLTTADGLGNVTETQARQGVGSGTFDSVQNIYSLTAGVGNLTQVSLPFAGGAGGGGSVFTKIQNDALGRPQTTTDNAGNVIATYTYIQNDVLQTLASPSVQKQLEYDGLGRLTSVCEITAGTTAWPGGPCGQKNPETGYLTIYTYDTTTFNSNVVTRMTVQQNSQSGSTQTQTRVYLYDLLGRLVQETNPETGTTQYFWDATPTACAGGYTTTGDLGAKQDNAGVYTCYGYDALHRLQGFSHATGHNCTGFIYDSATPPTGVTVQDTKGRMVEAYTNNNCDGGGSLVTDEWFSYSPRGEVTDIYTKTPNSAGYYHVTKTYWENGTVKSLGGLPGVPTISYGVDGEGRWNSVSAGSTLVTSTSYNPDGQVNTITFPSGDSDSYLYDGNTGRMTQYTFAVNGQSVIGQPTWNSNGTLKKFQVTQDPFNPANVQTCTYGYDDLARVNGANCGSVWAQTFSFDPFGNISKSGNVSFQPTYNSNNQYQMLPGCTPKYDPDGRPLDDGFHSYQWDANGHATTLNSSACSPQLLPFSTQTFDAQGNLVEVSQPGWLAQYLHDTDGRLLGSSRGQSAASVDIPLPGGAKASYSGSVLGHYRHGDWLGTVRFDSNTNRTVFADVARAPYGEEYAISGPPYEPFAGLTQSIAPDLFDTQNREYHPTQGRWISPDPAGLAAVDPSNPQSWNRYAYVANNPLSFTDPTGLQLCEGCHFLGGGGAGGCSMDGVDTPCELVNATLQGGGASQCPNNNCGIGTATPYQCVGSVCGYMSNQYAGTHANEVNGQLLTNGQYNAYILSTYGSQIDAQRQALASAIAANSGGTISYQQAYDSLDPNGGHLNGGNYNFTETIYGPGNLICGADASRCNGVHFPDAGVVHLDTSNPWNGVGSFFEHAGVDVILGNVFYTVIPRPWP